MNLICGDSIEVMATLPEASVDAIVTDPPYGLEFMGKEWDKLDAGLPQEAVWKGRHGKGGSSIGTDDSKPGSRHHVGYGGGQQGFKRCTTCGKRAFSGSPCQCAEPTWVVEYNAGPPSSSIRMQRWHHQWAEAAYRVAKPSAYLLAFGGTRTVHRMTCALEDAGWIIRDMLVWGYASGFPKSKASLKPAWEPIVMARKPGPLRMLAIDECRIGLMTEDEVARSGRSTTGMFAHGGIDWKRDGVAPLGRWPANIVLSDELFEPGVPGVVIGGSLTGTMTAWSSSPDSEPSPTASPASNAVRRSSRTARGSSVRASATDPAGTQLDAWGTSTDIPKPDTGCSDGTRAESSTTSGSTGTSGSRPTDRSLGATLSTTETATGSTTTSPTSNSSREPSTSDTTRPRPMVSSVTDETPRPGPYDHLSDDSVNWRRNSPPAEEPSSGYSRFFLVPKAARSDREPVLGGLPLGNPGVLQGSRNGALNKRTNGMPPAARANVHPTVKPIDLMRHLVRLVTPTGGVVLDPFLGSGTTALAAEMEGFEWIGIEREAEYVAIAEARLNGTQRGLGLEVG